MQQIFYSSLLNAPVKELLQEAQQSQGGRATVRSIVETLKCSLASLKVIENGTNRMLELDTVSYSHSTATVAVSLAVSIQHANDACDRQTPSQPDTARRQ